VSVRRALVACTLVLPVLAFRPPASAWAKKELAFVTPPALPTLSAVTLNARSQTVNTTMANFSVKDTRGTESGWNVTVGGQAGEKKSAVFAQYCPKAKCGSDAEGYVAGGHKLAANSLTLNSTGAKFSGGSGGTPALQCSSACNVDSASAVKVASATNGEETWTTSGFSATSLALAVPTTLFALANEEIYHVNILWTLSTGP
jgi:WxL domain surface cell wall-binding